MDQEVVKQFQEKNLDILKNKLKLDINNNMVTLTLSLNHILDLEVSSASLKIGIIYLDSTELFKEGVQDKLLISIGEKYIEVTKQYLKEKKADLHEFIDNIKLNHSIDLYYQFIEKMGDDFSVHLRDQLYLYIEDGLIKQIKGLNKLYSVVEKRTFLEERVTNFLKDSLVRRLVDKTIEQLVVRNQTLINNARDNYAHYSTLVEKTEV